MLILIRGLPGSGKSTMAKRLTDYVHVESDMFWGPKYKFNIRYIEYAYQWCLTETLRHLILGHKVVVADTFTTIKEMAPYFALGVPVEVITATGEYGTIHNVPEEVIQQMKDRWEEYPRSF